MSIVLAILAAMPLPAVAFDVPPIVAHPSDPQGVPIPAAIRAMLDAALASGNEGEIATIVKYARAADPASGDAVLGVAERWRADRDAARRQVIEQASFLALWSGKAELGGSLQTGNSESSGLSATMDLTREGLRWRQKVHIQADYQSTAGVATRDHFLASYEPNLKVNDRAYIYGAAQYESDRFLGYDNRLSASAGAGYNALKTPAVTLDVELGPAYRYTGFTDDSVQSSIAARGSIDLNWNLTRALSVKQQASTYVQRYNSTVSSTTALNARLLGPLSAQFSYNVQYESMPPAGSVSTDTTSRAALVYSF